MRRVIIKPELRHLKKFVMDETIVIVVTYEMVVTDETVVTYETVVMDEKVVTC